MERHHLTATVKNVQRRNTCKELKVEKMNPGCRTTTTDLDVGQTLRSNNSKRIHNRVLERSEVLNVLMKL